MRKGLTIVACVFLSVVLPSCSPRDFLTRRLAGDLIAGSYAFKTPQQFWLRTGIVSNQNYLAPEYLVLQKHGWISATAARCPPQVAPPPCWDVVLTSAGADTFRLFAAPTDVARPSFAVPAATRELLQVTGVSKQGDFADVDFTWRWVPSNEIGAAFYSSDQHYRSTVGFRHYDDGWRLVRSVPHSAQSLEDAFRNAEPVP
jgi:hypothetical protein